MFSRARSLRSNFHRDLIAGKFHAFGLFKGEAERVCIPEKRFADLYPRFATERLQGPDVEFTAVLIIEAEKRETPAAQFQRQLTNWIRARRADVLLRGKDLSLRLRLTSQVNSTNDPSTWLISRFLICPAGVLEKHLSGPVSKSSI
jgi:hypothetical protein